MRKELIVNNELDLSSPVTVVTFHADWCAPCKTLAPILDDVADIMSAEKISWVKVNVSDFPEMVVKYGIRGVPTTLIFKHDKVENVIVGLESAGYFTGKIVDAIGERL